jgi:hypothetical protein
VTTSGLRGRGRIICLVALVAVLGLPIMVSAEEAARPLNVAVLDLAAKVGIDNGRAEVFAELLQDHLRNQLKLRVIGRSDIEAMLGLEKMKDVLACSDQAVCLAEVGGALGVDELLTGSLAKMGSYLVVSIKRIDPKHARVLAQVTRKLKGATDDDLIEAVAPLVAELYSAEQQRQHEGAERAEALEAAKREQEGRAAEEARRQEDTRRAEVTRRAEERAGRAEEQARQALEAAQRAEAETRKAKEEAQQQVALLTRQQAQQREAVEQPAPRVAELPPSAVAAAADGWGLRPALGVSVGAIVNAEKVAMGAGLALELSVGWRRFELAWGYTFPKTLTTTMRLWVVRQAVELALVARGARYSKTAFGPSDEAGFGLGAGATLGYAYALPQLGDLAAAGVRFEYLYHFDLSSIGRHDPRTAQPMTLAAFVRY